MIILSREYKDYTQGVHDRTLQIRLMDSEGEVHTQIKQFRTVPPELTMQFIEELEKLIEILQRDSFQKVGSK